MAYGSGLIVFGKKNSGGGRSGLLIIRRTAQSRTGKLDVEIKRLCGSKQRASLFQTLLLLAALLPVLLLVLGHLLRPHLPHQIKEDLRAIKLSVDPSE